MINYYEILGLRTGAASLEIKTAFRRLAKLYHPDKNPAGKDDFAVILKAYEVLSDPVLKSAYDYKLKYRAESPNDALKNTSTKNWRFDEKELKRRQYYNEHIKKYAKKTENFEASPISGKTYNEYKYVLFATPLAVALFLLVMKLAAPSGIKQFSSSYNLGHPAPVSVNRASAHTGDTLYAGFFGGVKREDHQHYKLKICNQSGSDIILCVFDKHYLLNCSYIANGDRFELKHLPNTPLLVKYSSGLFFNPKKQLGKIPVKGAFDSLPYFYTGKVNPALLREFIVLKRPTKGFEKISADAFFKK